MTNFERITIDPTKMNGQPCIRGMRLTVRRVLEALAVYPDRRDLNQEYPELGVKTRTREDFFAGAITQ